MTVETPRPWYREPWPWVLIAIPMTAVVASGITIWLALTRPDYLVVDDTTYQQLRSELRANPVQQEPDENGEAGTSAARERH